MIRAAGPRRLAVLGALASLIALVAVPARGAADAAPARTRDCTRTVGPGAAVQATLDGLASRRGHVTLCLRPGEYVLPAFLAVERDGVTLRGAGDATVLRLRDGVQAPLVVVGDFRHRVPAHATSDVAIERMRLVGSGGGGSEFLAEYPYLGNSALVVRGGRRIALRDLDVGGCRSACLLTEHDTRDVAIERNRVHGSTWDGVSLNRTAHLRLTGNTIRDNRAAGITVEHLEDSLIAHNVVAGNGSHGVYLADAYRNRFTDNRFADNVNAGVFLTCSVRFRDPGPVLCWDDSMSAANRFEGNTFAGNRRDYIVAGDAAANCTKRDFVPNRSRGDHFRDGARIDQAATLGRCLEWTPYDPPPGSSSTPTSSATRWAAPTPAPRRVRGYGGSSSGRRLMASTSCSCRATGRGGRAPGACGDAFGL